MVAYELGFEEWVGGPTQHKQVWKSIRGQDNSIYRHWGVKKHVMLKEPSDSCLSIK